MIKTDHIYVAGHQGLVGTALWRALRARGYTNLVGAPFADLDLRDQRAVDAFFAQHRPAYVFLAAARVGGIQANVDYPASFIYDNLMIQANVINTAYRHGVKKLLFLGSSCIYPRDCSQPIREEYLLGGPLEQTNEPYAVAKIAGIKLCQAYNKQYGTQFISAMPTNLYGPGDTFDERASHVIPALILKMHRAKIEGRDQVNVWGTGTVRREFLFVDDLADALLFLMEHYTENNLINVGVGQDVTVAQLAHLIKEVVGFDGRLVFDTSKPDGTPRKLLDVRKITALGWQAQTNLRTGLQTTYEWFVQQQRVARSSAATQGERER